MVSGGTAAWFSMWTKIVGRSLSTGSFPSAMTVVAMIAIEMAAVALVFAMSVRPPLVEAGTSGEKPHVP
jgi:hypothetical protein